MKFSLTAVENKTPSSMSRGGTKFSTIRPFSTVTTVSKNAKQDQETGFLYLRFHFLHYQLAPWWE